MKTRIQTIFLAGVAAVLPVFAILGQQADPTRLTAPVADLLKAQLASFRSIELQGLVCAAPTNGVAMIRVAGAEPVVVRSGSELTLMAGDIPFRVTVTDVTDEGIGLFAEGLDETLRLPVAFARKAARAAQAPSEANLCYVEFDQMPLRQALKMLADQSQRNYICSEEAAQIKVSLFLRDLPVQELVEELCKSHALWYADRKGDSGSVRILTMREFQENLASFQQDEQSETFTLLYPNVTEVGMILLGLYRDRVVFSLGDQDLLEDDLSDLSRRFDRFNAMNRAANTDLMGEFNLQNSYSVNGRSSRRSGVYTLSREGGLEQVLRRDQTLKPLRAEDASKIQEAIEKAPATNRVETAAQAVDPYRNNLPPIYVTASRRNNMLIVRTSDPRVMEDIRALIQRIDQPTPMVLLELKIIELTLDDDFTSIVDYMADGNFNSGGNQHHTLWNSANKAGSIVADAMTFQIVNKALTARLQALQERGHTKVLATPTLLTANNEVSQLFIGKEVPITRNVESSTVVTENNVVAMPETTVEFERIGTQLLVTPSINADRTVMLRLLQQNSDLASEKGSIPVYNSQAGEVSNIPVDIVESRSVTGTFMAKDQMAIAVGGLIRETSSEKRSGIPILMDIPYLGWLFRSTKIVKARTELLILITPHVISTPSESGGVSSRVLRQSKNPDMNPYIPGDQANPGIKEQKEWRVDLTP
ncbi:MAG: type II secretion system protein GspD [Kiritimatiellae bacterium]|nr:type II secretion system protein GspD [Kiritimatiellia bacterium]